MVETIHEFEVHQSEVPVSICLNKDCKAYAMQQFSKEEVNKFNL
jgi:hypothetical protein